MSDPADSWAPKVGAIAAVVSAAVALIGVLGINILIKVVEWSYALGRESRLAPSATAGAATQAPAGPLPQPAAPAVSPVVYILPSQWPSSPAQPVPPIAPAGWTVSAPCCATPAISYPSTGASAPQMIRVNDVVGGPSDSPQGVRLGEPRVDSTGRRPLLTNQPGEANQPTEGCRCAVVPVRFGGIRL